MIVNYALTKMFSFIKNEKAFYMPYFLLMFLFSISETYFLGKGREASGMYLANLFIALIGIVVQVSYIYALNYTYGLRKGEITFFEGLWNGLCFAPGFILQTIKLILRSFLGLFLFIIPGVYWFFKHTLDPYYTLIDEEGSPYRKSFTRKDLYEVIFLLMPFTAISLIILPWASVFKMRSLEYLQTPISALLSLASLTAIYFYIDYLERVRTKSC